MVEWADGNDYFADQSLEYHDTDDIHEYGPNRPLGFEVEPTTDVSWTFAPEFYPEDFSQLKKRELDRNGKQCGGENVSIDAIKNREFHAEGVILGREVATFQRLLDYRNTVNILSPLTPYGGMECQIKEGELGSEQGWDPHEQDRLFDYTLDLVSTGRDEHGGDGQNAIVTGIIS